MLRKTKRNLGQDGTGGDANLLHKHLGNYHVNLHGRIYLGLQNFTKACNLNYKLVTSTVTIYCT